MGYEDKSITVGRILGQGYVGGCGAEVTLAEGQGRPRGRQDE